MFILLLAIEVTSSCIRLQPPRVAICRHVLRCVLMHVDYAEYLNRNKLSLSWLCGLNITITCFHLKTLTWFMARFNRLYRRLTSKVMPRPPRHDADMAVMLQPILALHYLSFVKAQLLHSV